MRRKCFLLLLAALVSVCASAGDYAVEIQPSKKIIYMDELNLPPDTDMENLLRILPELMHRGDVLFENYDVKFDGKSVGESRDVFLCQTRVRDVSKIEITTSAVETQSRDGQSGSVNFVPKAAPEGFGGAVSLVSTTEVDLMPSLDLSYSKNGFEMRGYANLEYYSPQSDKTITEKSDFHILSGTDITKQKYFQQTAKVNMKYNINEKNTVKAWLLESYGKKDTDVFGESEKYSNENELYGPDWFHRTTKKDTVHSSNNKLLLNLMAEYQHKTVGDGNLVFFAGYETSRNNNSDIDFSVPNVFNSELKYEQTALDTGDHKLKLKGGVNYSGTSKEMKESKGASIYLSPYFDFNYHYKGLWVNGTARYQYFERYFLVPNYDEFRSNEHDFVANLNTLWQICPHHALNLVMSKNIIRPDDNMLYPGFTYYPVKNLYIRGNPDLMRSSVYDVGLAYITDRQWNGRNLVFNVGVGYDKAFDLIESKTDYLYTVGDKPIFTPTTYVYYENTGVKDIAKVNLSAIYKYDILTLSLAGNLFCNFFKLNGQRNKSISYNISACSIIILPHGWNLSASVKYNSSILRQNALLGDRLLASAKVYKSFGRVNLSLELFDIFDYYTEDVENDGNMYRSTISDLYGRYLSFGINYAFGSRR